MDTDADSDSSRSAPVCSWCGRQLVPPECGRQARVCDRCARLLREAGVPEEEIWSDEGGGGDDN